MDAANEAGTSADPLRIVAIGASAGGLAALEAFFDRMPPDSGMAFVVVQHLDPTQKAMLAELLQRTTTMPVREAEQDMPLEPDSVYVIAPNSELSVVGDTLHLAKPTEPRGMRLPVNVLFSSLASARGERAIGVVLSGMGADGSVGLQAIKAVGGLGVVQDPATAQFDAMPRSALDAGGGDITGSPEELPGRILGYLRRVQQPLPEDRSTPSPEASTGPLQRITKLLQARTRHDFSLYKPTTVNRRIERRMAIHGIPSLAEYADYLERNPQEIDFLFRELLIGVTGFFRDPAVWDYLTETALPALLQRRRDDDQLRAWVIGCSTGEEAYSLAMALSDAVRHTGQEGQFSFQIFATDLSPEAITTARRGQYPRNIGEQVSAERLERYFSRHETHYQVSPAIRDMLLFAQHDVVLDPPFTRLDLIACRNLLIYFDPMLQRRLLPLFHYSLRAGGILALGSSETVGRFGWLFTPIEHKLRLYRRQDDAANRGPDILLRSFPPLSRQSQERPVSSPEQPPRVSDSLQAAADQVLLQVYAPAAVLLNADGDIVYISGRTGNYLEPAAGRANWNIHAMAREGLRDPLAMALNRAGSQRAPVQLHDVPVETPGGSQVLDVTVQAFQEPAVLQGMTLVVFREGRLEYSGEGEEEPLETSGRDAQLRQYRDEIQSLREEARASREELQSANEELQSTNEELQSANEELTTSKEEMQSMNEELQTINSEMQTKLDDLALAQSDMQNLLNSIEIAILFLDQGLNVRRYTERAASIISLRDSDVGRPLSDLTSSLQYPGMLDDARQTLRTLAVSEKQIRTSSGRWFSVRIMPYRRLDNVIDGVVITLLDITDTKTLEASLRGESPP